MKIMTFNIQSGKNYPIDMQKIDLNYCAKVIKKSQTATFRIKKVIQTLLCQRFCITFLDILRLYSTPLAPKGVYYSLFLRVDSLANAVKHFIHSTYAINCNILILLGIVLGNNLCLLAINCNTITYNILRSVVSTA